MGNKRLGKLCYGPNDLRYRGSLITGDNIMTERKGHLQKAQSITSKDGEKFSTVQTHDCIKGVTTWTLGLLLVNTVFTNSTYV